MKSFSNAWCNLSTKSIILDIKSRSTCVESNMSCRGQNNRQRMDMTSQIWLHVCQNSVIYLFILKSGAVSIFSWTSRRELEILWKIYKEWERHKWTSLFFDISTTALCLFPTQSIMCLLNDIQSYIWNQNLMVMYWTHIDG